MKGTKCVHFIGIGGAGMSGLAKILLQKNIKVTGSDLSYSKYIEGLEELGAKIYIGHKDSNLSSDVDLVIISTAIPNNNPELIKAKELGIKVIKRGELLGEIMKLQKGIAVAGAHGKTTSSSMVAVILEYVGFDPTIVIGGELFNLSSNAKLGKGEYMVAEADESDGSFLKLFPHIAIITNIEDDHLDHYGSLENIIKAFQQFIGQVSEEGTVLLGADDPTVRNLDVSKHKNIKYYGIRDNPDYVAKNLILDSNSSSFDVYYRNNFIGKVSLAVAGAHNISNALGALAAALEAGVDFEDASKALMAFKGVQRRFQLLGNHNNVQVVDDYAHHPTEIRATLKAARQSHKGRVVAVFQPHRFSRTKQLYREFGSSFGDADMIVITDIYAAGEKPIPGIDSKLIYSEAKNCFPDKEIVYIETEELTNYLYKNIKPGDLILTLGAGDIWQRGKELVQLMGE